MSDKYQQKRQLLLDRSALALNISAEDAAQLLSIPPRQSLRINTLKTSPELVYEWLSHYPVHYTNTPWLDEGVFIEEGVAAIRDSPEALDGTVYIQNAASWLPVIVLDPHPNESILDMCAAPGGKTSHIAQKAQNQALITANDNSRPRLMKLQRNLERLGVNNVTYTLHDASRLSHHLEEGSFDKILLDAPCSGEGMMQLNRQKDFDSWSVAHIKRLQQLQKRLIVQAWKLLKPGGRLVYSTCTMAPEENEAVIDYLLRHNDDVTLESLDSLTSQLSNQVAPVLQWNQKRYDERIQNVARLKPSEVVEAFFIASLVKNPENTTRI
jgi:16S rRNA (cytosine1407-C5)-methyltransferase